MSQSSPHAWHYANNIRYDDEEEDNLDGIESLMNEESEDEDADDCRRTTFTGTTYKRTTHTYVKHVRNYVLGTFKDCVRKLISLKDLPGACYCSRSA